jgi:hypothetical protein
MPFSQPDRDGAISNAETISRDRTSPQRPTRALSRALQVLAFALAQSTMLPLLAHRLGEGYIILTVHPTHLEGRIEVRLADLDRQLKLDADTDGKVGEEEIRAAHGRIAEYLGSGVAVASGGIPFTLDTAPIETWSIGLGRFVRLPFRTGALAAPLDRLEVSYELLFETQPNHRGYLIFEKDPLTGRTNDLESVALVFTSSERSKEIDLTKPSHRATIVDFLIEGIWHIWIGLDHILFLVALLLPSVLVRRDRRWGPVEGFRSALWNVFRVVTLFTLAHSVTLSLAALDIVRLESRWVESIIAVSIAVAAIDNLFPVYHRHVWIVVFGFGLFHGFGFASVLADLGLESESILAPLVGFNLGVEIGQLAIIAVLFPLLWAVRRSAIYYRGTVTVGSIVLIVIALRWFVERAFGAEE